MAVYVRRFGVLPFHRAYLAKAGLPKQNGQTHAEAGDLRSQELSLVTKVGGPVPA